MLREQFILQLLLSQNFPRDTVDIENIEPTTAADHHNDWVANIEEVAHTNSADEAQA